MIGLGNGTGAPLSFLVVGVLCLLFSTGFTAMVPHVGSTGAFYAYLRSGLGRPMGLVGAFLAVTTYVAILAGFLAFGGLVLGDLVHEVFSGPQLPWWIWSGVMWAGISVLSLFNIDVSAKVLTCLELALILVWELVVAVHEGPSGHAAVAFSPSSFKQGSIGTGLLFAVLCNSGFEAAAVFRQEARHPDPDVPRATYLTVVFLAVLYSLGAWLFIVSFGTHDAVAAGLDPTGSFASSVGNYLGRVASDAVYVLLATSSFAGVLANQNIAARYLFALGQDGELPKRLGKAHPRHRSPVNAALVVSGTVFVIEAVGAAARLDIVPFYSAFTGVGSLCLILSMTLVSVAVFGFFRRRRELGVNRWRTIGAPLGAFVGLGAVLVLATAKLDVLVGSRGTALTLEIVITVIALSGLVLAGYLKARRPDVYARIGEQQI
ncbi:APC family permease [Streptomyces sp. NBC_00882]|nr:APC family permease [Streptomyces sp. NBC_00882]